jgi:hypothetical protein
MDPPEPSPAVAEHAVLSAVPAEAADAFVAAAMASRPTSSELRHLGGAFTRRPEHAGAVASMPGEYLLASVSIVPAPEFAAAAVTATHGVVDALADWHTDALALTFVDGGGVDRRGGFGDSVARLAELKREFDTSNVFAAGHPIP